ncbi:MAG: ribosome small subunit-dependent GTPase A [Candidatus Nanopelagicales bacterium]|jgi:ribosome biogenesis GTPase
MARGRGRDLDEDDVRVRPSRGKSRPRSKDRPSHADATTAMVVAVDRGRFTLATDDGTIVLAVKARELGRKGVVVGDRVAFTGGGSGVDDLARVVRIDDRRTVLRRTADDSDPVERVIVANADQLAIVTALANPEPRLGFIDRALVAAFDAGIAPLLILTKADLADAQPLIDAYAALDVPAIAVARGAGKEPVAADLETVRAQLSDQVTVLVGQSGVGKSTLVNALVPGADRATGHVNDVTGRGRHTSTSAVVLALPGGGWIVDTPGVRSFGLAHVSADTVIRAFDDLAPGLEACPRGCTHDEDECGLDAYVGDDPHLRARLDSLRRLLGSRTVADDG